MGEFALQPDLSANRLVEAGVSEGRRTIVQHSVQPSHPRTSTPADFRPRLA
ncbi:MAG: hypothetical protein ACK6D6_21855 [Planctomyces sp.]